MVGKISHLISQTPTGIIPAVAETFFIKRGDKVQGPATLAQIENLRSKLKANDLIAKAANGPWTNWEKAESMLFPTIENATLEAGASYADSKTPALALPESSNGSPLQQAIAARKSPVKKSSKTLLITVGATGIAVLVLSLVAVVMMSSKDGGYLGKQLLATPGRLGGVSLQQDYVIIEQVGSSEKNVIWSTDKLSPVEVPAKWIGKNFADCPSEMANYVVTESVSGDSRLLEKVEVLTLKELKEATISLVSPIKHGRTYHENSSIGTEVASVTNSTIGLFETKSLENRTVVTICDRKTGVLRSEHSIPGLAFRLVFSPNGDLFALQMRDKEIVSVHDAATGKELYFHDLKETRAFLSFSLDSRLLVLSGGNNVVVLESTKGSLIREENFWDGALRDSLNNRLTTKAVAKSISIDGRYLLVEVRIDSQHGGDSLRGIPSYFVLGTKGTTAPSPLNLDLPASSKVFGAAFVGSKIAFTIQGEERIRGENTKTSEVRFYELNLK